MSETPEIPPEMDEPTQFPEVEPEDLRNYGRFMRGLRLPSASTVDLQTNLKSDRHSLHIRWSILELMNRRHVLDAWIHDGEYDDFVIRVVASYPLEPAPPPEKLNGRGHPIPAGEIFEKIKSAAPG